MPRSERNVCPSRKEVNKFPAFSNWGLAKDRRSKGAFARWMWKSDCWYFGFCGRTRLGAIVPLFCE
jgi:hypothetical protein